MKISGNYTIDAPREQVWAALNDIGVLARIVPGCERLEQIGENEYEGIVKIGIQTIKGTYNGRIRIEDIQPPHHYRLVAKGRSANGIVDGAGTVDLAEQEGKTALTYAGDAQIGGVLASVGQRLIEGASKQLINQSLKALAEQVAARNAPPSDQEGAAPNTSDQAADTPAPSGDSNSAAQAPPEQPRAAPAAQAAPPPSQPAPCATLVPQQPQPSFERRTVVVPEHEQLKPAAVARGVMDDFLQERPWLPWIVVAFVLGFLFGRSRR